jgi:hypothetical protein
MKRKKRSVLLACSIVGGIVGYGSSSFIVWYCSGCMFVLFVMASAIERHALTNYRVVRIAHSDRENNVVETNGQVHLVLDKLIGFTLCMKRPHRVVIPLPWVTVKESWLHVQTGRKISFHWVFTPWWSRTIRINYHLIDLERGQYVAQDIEFITSDGFGFIEKRQAFPVPFQFDVLPAKMTDLPPSSVKVLLDGIRDTPFTSSTNVANGLRDYQVGEPLSQIDWKSSARHRKWISKMNESQQLPSYVIFLDEQLDYIHVPSWNGAIHDHGESDDPNFALHAEHGEDRHAMSCVPPLFPLYERRIALSLHLWESLRCTGQHVEWVCSQAHERMAVSSHMRASTIYRISARLQGTYDSRSQLLARRIREEFGKSTAHVSLICVTSQISLQVLQALAEVRSKHIAVHVYVVNGSSQLSHTDRKAQKLLQAIGCCVLVVPHERSMWPAGCRVLDTTRGHYTPMCLNVMQHNRQAHALRSPASQVNTVQQRGGTEGVGTYSS